MVLLLVACGNDCQAQVRPQPGLGDARLQAVDFRPDQVVLIESAPGYQVTVEIAPDEQIQSIAIGDSSSWQVTADKAGNHLFLKPLRSPASTNMIVRTSVRMYAFDLAAADTASSSTPYVVRFRYPAVATLESDAGQGGHIVGQYRLSGSRALRPSAISDDGQRTSIEWPPSASLPAIYAIDVSGREALANGYMRGGRYVIDSVSPHLVFRIDKQVARAARFLPRKRQGG